MKVLKNNVKEVKNIVDEAFNSDDGFRMECKMMADIMKENSMTYSDLTETEEQFKVDSLEKATWAFNKIRELNKEIKQNEDLYNMEKERIDNWLKDSNGSLKNSKEYFEGLILAYYMEGKKNNDKFKINTPSGKVTTRQSTSWKPKKELITYLKENNLNDLIEVKEDVSLKELKSHFKGCLIDDKVINQDTGEVVPIDVITKENVSIKVEE